MRRIERDHTPIKRLGVARRRRSFVPLDDQPASPDLALAYSNGYVTVEISHEALEAYMDMTGDVPLPIVDDPTTGDRRAYDARHKVRVVYDADANVREVSTRSRDGLFVRVNFTDAERRAG